MLCTSQGMLFDRIEATQEANLFEPHYYRHILSDSFVSRDEGDVIETTTNFLCVRTMLNGDSMLFVSGRYIDEVVAEDGQPRYRSKMVVLDQCKIDTLIAIPL
jgi:anthranilate 1,2-dioxygenase small subunit